MLSIEKVRGLIKDSEKYPDEEIEKIRDEIRALAETIFEDWKEKSIKNK